MIKLTPRYTKKGGIDLTALIDLVFLLVVFFMVSSSLGKTSSIHVTVPFAKNSGESQSASAIITVDSDNKIFLNDSPVNEEQLEQVFSDNLERLQKDTVLIRGDESSDYGVIIRIMDSLSSVGINDFTFSTSVLK
ncbi:MAG: biopolymer transporter ExbD [Spirochaetes bacterium]|nr:biopolymer transporter ExbD [Spirochaetota bacterium]